jgi:hypothetical protein
MDRNGWTASTQALATGVTPVKTARIVDYPNSSCFAPNAPSRAHRDDDYVLVLKLDERTPEGIHPLGPRLEVDPAGRGTVAPPRPNERITRTGSSSAAGSRPRRGFFLARRAVFAFSTMWILQALHFAPPDYHYLWKAAGGLVPPDIIQWNGWLSHYSLMPCFFSIGEALSGPPLNP